VNWGKREKKEGICGGRYSFEKEGSGGTMGFSSIYTVLGWYLEGKGRILQTAGIFSGGGVGKLF